MKNKQFTADQLQAYVDHIVNDYMNWSAKTEYTNPSSMVVTFEEGSKFIRVVTANHGSRSSHSFIDAAGKIWKCASWKSPAKNFTRGDIVTPDFRRVTWTGAH